MNNKLSDQNLYNKLLLNKIKEEEIIKLQKIKIK